MLNTIYEAKVETNQLLYTIYITLLINCILSSLLVTDLFKSKPKKMLLKLMISTQPVARKYLLQLPLEKYLRTPHYSG